MVHWLPLTGRNFCSTVCLNIFSKTTSPIFTKLHTSHLLWVSDKNCSYQVFDPRGSLVGGSITYFPLNIFFTKTTSPIVPKFIVLFLTFMVHTMHARKRVRLLARLTLAWFCYLLNIQFIYKQQIILYNIRQTYFIAKLVCYFTDWHW